MPCGSVAPGNLIGTRNEVLASGTIRQLFDSRESEKPFGITRACVFSRQWQYSLRAQTSSRVASGLRADLRNTQGWGLCFQFRSPRFAFVRLVCYDTDSNASNDSNNNNDSSDINDNNR